MIGIPVDQVPVEAFLDIGEFGHWTIVTGHGVFKSDRLHERWHTTYAADVLGNPGGEVIHHLTSVRLSDRTAFYDKSEHAR